MVKTANTGDSTKFGRFSGTLASYSTDGNQTIS
jgi:hypothetical protein